jgi:hypothetical protein
MMILREELAVEFNANLAVLLLVIHRSRSGGSEKSEDETGESELWGKHEGQSRKGFLAGSTF